jgi:hypothetical protein
MSQSNSNNNNDGEDRTPRTNDIKKYPAAPLATRPLTGMSEETYLRFMRQIGVAPVAWVPEETLQQRQ